MKHFTVFLSVSSLMILSIIGLATYTLVGTNGRVQTIKEMAPQQMDERNWKIIRYEGYQYGSWNNHGGKVWYHVANIDNPNIQYRVYVTLWDGELQWHYNEPEVLNRLELKHTH